MGGNIDEAAIFQGVNFAPLDYNAVRVGMEVELYSNGQLVAKARIETRGPVICQVRVINVFQNTNGVHEGQSIGWGRENIGPAAAAPGGN
jgi:hypothetical protein